jgi:hypothetical protein
MLIHPADPDHPCPVAELSPAERRMRAAQYRQLAAGIVSVDVRNTLLQLAVRHESLAAGESGADGTAARMAD